MRFPKSPKTGDKLSTLLVLYVCAIFAGLRSFWCSNSCSAFSSQQEEGARGADPNISSYEVGTLKYSGDQPVHLKTSRAVSLLVAYFYWLIRLSDESLKYSLLTWVMMGHTGERTSKRPIHHGWKTSMLVGAAKID